MTRWRLVKPELPHVVLVADTSSEEKAQLIEAAAAKAGVELVRVEPSEEELREFVAAAGWQASSAPEYEKLPHQYTVRGRKTAGVDPPPTEMHDGFRAYIRRHGYKRDFTNPETGKTFTYTYLNLDGYRYWTFQFIINRVPVEDTTGLEPE